MKFTIIRIVIVITYFAKLNYCLPCTLTQCIIDSSCPSFEPFKCPGEEKCIAIQVKSSAFKTTYFYSYFQYLCDGAVDCNDGYDEDTNLCTAGITVNQSQVFVFVSH